MMDVHDLYQDVIIDHNAAPRNFGELKDANCSAVGFNPLCGDKLSLHLKLLDDKIVEVKFIGSGCAISTASASLMTESLKNKSKAQAEALFKHFHAMLVDADHTAMANLGKLQVLAGVTKYPSRIKCATLAWHTLRAALKNSNDVACTEV